MFFTVFSFNAIIGTIIGIVLLQSEGLRIILYVVMTIMCINSFLIQLCKCLDVLLIDLPMSVEEEKAVSSTSIPFWKDVKDRFMGTVRLVLSKQFAPLLLYSVYNGVRFTFYRVLDRTGLLYVGAARSCGRKRVQGKEQTELGRRG